MSAVLFASHNDDEVLWTFYNLLRYKPHVIIVLRSYIEAAQGGPHFVRREAETAAAMRIARVTWEQWDHPDIDPDFEVIGRQMVTAIHEGIDTVIAPAYEEGGHEHHNEIALLAQRLNLDLVQYLSYVRSHGRSTGGTEIVPTLFEREQKKIALRCYQSQIDYEPTAPWFGVDQREFVL